MINVADIDLPAGHARSLYLGMAPETKIHIPLGEKFGINRAVRVVAGGAALPQCGMLENKRAGLFAVAGGAPFVEARHGQAPARFEDIAAVRVVALGAIHLVFKQRMMLRKTKLCFHRAMTLETGGGILAGIDDRFAPAPAADDMEAARAVAGFAAGLAHGAGIIQTDARVRAGQEVTTDISVALGASVIADEPGPGNLGRDRQAYRCRRTRIQCQGYARSKPQGNSGGQVSRRFFARRLASHRLCE